ncbi:MAG: PQQ-binding-like beta-propeller repeat protein [Verrucomicrobiota bacterium]
MNNLSRLLTFAAFLAVIPAFAGNWPQFHGPNIDRVSDETDLPTTWSATENLVWKRELPGIGNSCPIIWDNAIFITTYTGEGAGIERHLFRIDPKSGETIWQKSIPVWHAEDPFRGYITEHGYASNTPVTDGERIYCYFGKAGVYAFDFDGKQLWKAETGDSSSRRVWGSASSPVLYGDNVIIPAGDEMRAIVALNKETGDVAWKAEGDRMESSYGTPVVMKVSDERDDLIFALQNEVWGMNPDTGKLRWFAEYNLPGNMSNTVSIAGDILTISGGFPRTARVALKGGGKGDMSDSLLYDTQKPATYMTAPVLHEGTLYWISDSGIAFAAKPGEEDPIWEERMEGLEGAGGRGKPFYASPILADGKIYAVSRANGVFVIDPSTEGLKVLAQNKIEGDASLFNASIAVSGGKIYLRSEKVLYCIGQ